MTTLKVNVIRKPTIKVKVLPRFPSSVSVTSPILLNRAGGNYAFSFDVSTFTATLGNLFQPVDDGLSSLAALTTAGFVTETALNTFVARTLTAPAAGITITNPAGTAGNPTLVLANDLAAVEGLSSTGIARRTGTDAWSVGTAVTNAEHATMAAWTFKANTTSGSATPTDITIDGLTLKATPASGDEVILWDVAGAAIKKATVTSLASSAGVSSIAGNTGAFTLGIGLTNSVNDIRTSLSSVTNSLGADVAMNNTSNYFDGPSIAQGTSGTWFVAGTVTIADPTNASTIQVKLWDGTTVIASTEARYVTLSVGLTISLSGVITSPAANLRISCKSNSTSALIKFNESGNSKDSTINAVRIA